MGGKKCAALSKPFGRARKTRPLRGPGRKRRAWAIVQEILPRQAVKREAEEDWGAENKGMGVTALLSIAH